MILKEEISSRGVLEVFLPPPPLGILQTYPILKRISSCIFKEMFSLCMPGRYPVTACYICYCNKRRRIVI